MPPKKGGKDKKKGGGAEEMSIPPIVDRTPLEEAARPANVPPLVEYSGTPRPLIPVWSDEGILTEDWGDPDSDEKYTDCDVKLPGNMGEPVSWLRPTEYIKQPPKPEEPEMTEEEKAAAEKAKAEADKKKKGKKPAKGKAAPAGGDDDDPYKIVPNIVVTPEEEAWNELCKDAAAKAKAEEDGATAPEHDGAVPRKFSRGFVRVWSDQQKEDIAADKAMRENLAIQRKEREELKQALLAEAQELGEDPASWLADFDETEGVKNLEDPPVLELTPEGEEVEAAFASLLRVVFEHADNVLDEDPFLWECIYPQEDGRPILNPAGKYVLKVFQAGEWRKLVIDDRMPVDASGELLLVSSTNPGELWPTLIAKGLYKLYQSEAMDNPSFGSTVGANSASLAAYTLHTLCGWLPELLPVLEGEKGWNLLLGELPHQKEEHEEHENSEDGKEAQDALAEGNDEENNEDGEEVPELTEEEKAAKEAEEAEAKARAEAEAAETARIAALRTKIPLLVTTQMYTAAGDVKTWTDVTSEGEASKIEEINAEGQVNVVTQTGKQQWVHYEEMESEKMRVLLLHSRYQATNRATMDCHWKQVGAADAEPEADDPKAKKGKGKKEAEPEPEAPAADADAQPAVFRPPESDTILCLQVDDTQPEAEADAADAGADADGEAEAPAADAAAAAPVEEETIVVVCLALDGHAEPAADGADATAVIRLEEELPPAAHGTVVGGDAGRPPAWVTGNIEKPAGEKSMGSYKILVYTPEQQKRLGVDESGASTAAPAPAGDLLTFQLSTATLQSATFAVPKGSSKLFQVAVEAPRGYTVTFASSAKLTVLDIAAGRSEQFGVRVVEAEGTYAPANAGEWSVWTRQVFTLPADPEPEEPAGDDADADAGAAAAPERTPMKTMAWLQLADADISPYVTLYTIDNDTAAVTKHPGLSTCWMELYANQHGYTVLAAARCRGRALPAGSWRLCVAGEGEGMTDLATQDAGVTNAFSATYVPNKYFTLFRDVLSTATDPSALAMRLTCSDPAARLRLAVYETPAEVEFSLEEDEETGLIAPPVVPPKKLLAEVRTRGSALLLGVDALAHALPEVDPKASELPAQYIVEASLDAERWGVPDKYRSVLPFYRREAAAAEAAEEGAGGEDGAPTSEQPPHLDLPPDSDMTWTLQLVSADELTMRPDGEKETVECMRRQMWEAMEPGRQVQAKISRLRYLGETEKADALQEAVSEAAGGGGKDKKGKGKDADLDAEAAAEAKVARRAALQQQEREPAVRKCPAGGSATILTPEARVKLDEARAAELQQSAEVAAQLVSAREEAAAVRKEALAKAAEAFADGRAKDTALREEIYQAKEDWRINQLNALAQAQAQGQTAEAS